MITINRKNPTEGEVTSSLSNAEDGGLHFDGAAGNIDIASPPDLGTKFSFELIIKCDEFGVLQQNFIDFGTNGRFVIASNSSMSWNLGIYDATSWKSFGVKVLDDLKVHHLVVTIDDTAAVLYDNGNQVATVTISANHAIDTCTDARIGSAFNGSGDFVSGTISRTRFYNRVLSGSEIKEKFENQNLKFSDIYGSQTKVIDSDFNGSLDGWNTYNDWNTQTNNSNAMQLGASAATQVCRNSVSLVGGKKYRVEYTASALTGAPTFNSYDSGNYTAQHTITAGSNSFEMDWPVGNSVDFLYIRAESATAAVTLDDIFVYQIGAVSSYELQSASPTQSLMVQDSSGVADGTCSASGITQIQPLTQINAVAARIGTSAASPADGELAVSSKIGISTTGSARQLHVKNTSGYAGAEFEATAENDDAFVTFNTHGNAAYIGIDDSADVLKLNATSGLSSAAHIAITSAGLVGIGSALPGRLLELSNGTNPALRINNGNSTADIGVASSAGAIMTGASDDDLVIARNGAYGIAIGTNGQTRMAIDSAGQVDVVSGNAHISSATQGSLNFGNVATNTYAKVEYDDTNGNFNINNTRAYPLRFLTNDTERLSISSAGTVKIVSAEVNDNLIIESTSTNDATAPDVVFYRNSTSPAANDMIGVLRFRGRNSTPADTEYAAITTKIIDPNGGTEDAELGFWTTGSGSITERMTISSTGSVTFQNGITFGNQTSTSATGATTNSTKLDHYEEGSWTGVVTGDSTAGTYTVGTTVGKYTRIGNVVNIYLSLVNISTSSAGSGNLKIAGLPFTSNTNSGQGFTGSVRFRGYDQAGSFYPVVSSNASYMLFMKFVQNGNDSPALVSNVQSGITDISVSLTYQV